jgi:2-polyprenyl-3-methyl-5-hydroxy-6-metoxy-1,4-benzoquinol methylase
MDKYQGYWDSEWSRRIKSDADITMNAQKADLLIRELWSRPQLIGMRKLEIGCGPAVHIRALASVCAEWSHQYTGIDTSEVAVESAKRCGLNVLKESIYTFETGDRFDAFFLFDVLEHLEDHESVAARIKDMSSESVTMLVNIPLYKSDPEKNGGFERLLSIKDMHRFFNLCGVPKCSYNVYGINGWPYMLLEGASE